MCVGIFGCHTCAEQLWSNFKVELIWLLKTELVKTFLAPCVSSKINIFRPRATHACGYMYMDMCIFMKTHSKYFSEQFVQLWNNSKVKLIFNF